MVHWKREALAAVAEKVGVVAIFEELERHSFVLQVLMVMLKRQLWVFVVRVAFGAVV